MSVAALVPIKTNSRRLPNKNFLQLGGEPMCSHIFNTLSKVNSSVVKKRNYDVGGVIS